MHPSKFLQNFSHVNEANFQTFSSYAIKKITPETIKEVIFPEEMLKELLLVLIKLDENLTLELIENSLRTSKNFLHFTHEVMATAT
jgi:hypothetical protein